MTYYDRLLRDFPNSEVTTLEQAVARFVAPIRAAYLDDAASPHDVESLLWAAWDVVIHVATDRPDTQDHLVGLVVEISAQGPLVRDADGRVCQVFDGLTVFTDLPCLGAQMREHMDIFADPRLTGGDHVPRENFMAFAARLTSAGIDFSRFAVWTYRECVGTEPVDLTLFRIWHRFGGSELVRRLTEQVAQAPLLPPPDGPIREPREALREAWEARVASHQAGEAREGQEALQEAWSAWAAEQAHRQGTREAPEAREALRLIDKLNRERRDD